MDQKAADRAFDRIYAKTYRKAAAYITAHCCRISDVEDLLQETYLAVYRVLAKKHTPFLRSEEAYVISVARAKLADSYRRQNVQPRITELFRQDEDGEEWLLSIADPQPTPEEHYQNAETLACLRGLLEKQDVPLQQAFYLHHCFGLSFPEIGRLQNRSEATVRSQVYRLTQDLRAKMERSAV